MDFDVVAPRSIGGKKRGEIRSEREETIPM